MIIEELREALLTGIPVEYTVHCQKRMLERDISKKDIKNCILNGEIIEDYPLEENNTNDFSYPSCLILWIDIQNNGAIHIVVGFNGRKIIIISAYYPNKEIWENDFRTRKEK